MRNTNRRISLEKVEEAITAVIETSALHGHIATDTSNLKNFLRHCRRQEFNQFCQDLVSVLRTCLIRNATGEKAKEIALTRFHTIRLT